jgi:acyl-CoA thioester hydrolase/1,4-dihydroxy-2-naphthoyl-CoA hydrolase
MQQVFRTQKTITFREADPARIMFFGNAFSFAHDAFEQFLPALGYRWKEWFHNKELMIPIRHSEGDFLAPFFPGETYEIAVSVASLGNSSFKMKYVFSHDGKTHAVVTMVHSVLDSQSQAKRALPEEMRARLEKFLEAP